MREKTFSKKSMTRYFTVFKGVKMPWILILCALVSSIIMMNAELSVATMTADIIDTSQKAINGAVLLGFIGMTILSAAANIISTYFTRKMEETITCGVRTKLWKKIMHLPSKYYDEDNGNELVTRVTSDASAPSSLITTLISCIVCVVTTVQAFSQLFAYHSTLAWYSMIIIPLTLIFCVLYSILQFKLGVYQTATMAGSMGYLAERVRNFRLIKSAVAESHESIQGNKTFKEMYKAEFWNWMMVAGYQLSSSLFSIMFIVISFVLGGQLLSKGEVTIGDLTGFYMVTGIVSLQLMQLFMNAGGIFGTFGTMKKTADIMEMDPEPVGGADVPSVCRDLVFDDVTFAYNAERQILKGVTVTIPMGKVTAIIGGNGAGKTTLFKLLTRLYEPENGQILFGDEDIDQYEITQWRDRFTYVFQKNPLIGGTVRENMLYGLDREVSEEELIEAAKKANCYDCIMEKPDGFNEDVGLGGSNFSGGQAQCISIARAMLRNGDYLLLDEATSNLDVLSEALVTDALNKLMENKTTIMIAHNYAATCNADYVIVMRDGIVEAAGTPEELKKSNEYYQLFSEGKKCKENC